MVLFFERNLNQFSCDKNWERPICTNEEKRSPNNNLSNMLSISKYVITQSENLLLLKPLLNM